MNYLILSLKSNRYRHVEVVKRLLQEQSVIESSTAEEREEWLKTLKEEEEESHKNSETIMC
jgi:hypothetical protein